MQAARQTLVERNRLLCAKHAAIGEQIAALARLDLVKQRASWFSAVEAVRRVFVRAEGDFPRDLQVPAPVARPVVPADTMSFSSAFGFHSLDLLFIPLSFVTEYHWVIVTLLCPADCVAALLGPAAPEGARCAVCT